MSLSVFILPAGRHAMLLQSANMYARTSHLSTKYNTKHNFCGLGSLRYTLYRFVKLSHDLTTPQLIIITGLQTPNFTCNL